MNGGLLRHRIFLQSPSASQNTDGENVQSFTTYAVVWANVVGLNGRQLALTQANTITSTATHSITIRYRKDITVTHQIAFANEISQPTQCITGFDGLTSEAFDCLTSNGEPIVSTAIKLFRINSIIDPDGRRRQLNIVATEVAA
jgi:SPP1 family predicted phage head-tail adaptor